jgi:pyruvate dehydrogenase E2 component (dihydrolipoamide acetyltransferase)
MSQETKIIEVKVPDIGNYQDVPIIEIFVGVGDTVEADQSLMTLESDKATIDIPSPEAGVIRSLEVKVGDHVSAGTVILRLESVAEDEKNSTLPTDEETAKAHISTTESSAKSISSFETPSSVSLPISSSAVYASPTVRKLARELGVEVGAVAGHGPKGRVTKEDIQNYVQQAGASSHTSLDQGLSLQPWPIVDFAQWGPTTSKPLSRIQKLSGAALHRNWVRIPHVTTNEAADITELEAFRIQTNKENEKSGAKITLLAFLIKACATALARFPNFNTSLVGDELVLKQYCHIGFAADTPQGLVVPVIRDADQKNVLTLAQETAQLAQLARDGKLKPQQMQGGCFSISSLGGIGATAFTPIINAPEVAILGVCRSAIQPVWDGQEFLPRLILPLCLSYDHRVIDGAEAARFNAYLAGLLADFRRVTL